MPAHHPRPIDWPTRWLMTDTRLGDRLIDTIRRLPEGSGLIFRYADMPRDDRLRLGLAVAREATRGGLVIGVSGDVALAQQLGADLVHNPVGHPGLLPHSSAIHDDAQARQARRNGAAVVFVSPVFPSRSHPRRVALGAPEAARLARMAGGTAIALGGMDERRFANLGDTFHGYAGITCWLER